MALTRTSRRAPLFPGALRSVAARGHSGGGSDAGVRRQDSPSGLYELLGVPPTATQTQIKTAYYKQSFLYHPDRNAGSEEAAERFTRVNEAYLVLGSVALRKKYDRGILSRRDVRMAGKPSGREPASSPPPRRTQTFTASSHPPHNPHKPIFDFDKFYREHYGEQLQREQLIRERQKELKKRKEIEKQWNPDDLKNMAFVLTFVAALAFFLGRK
ncbi:PREDICTED: dnaJ homolog subfamily C member 30 [Gekko japonicus]|uniref:DnaJ homolog subfamily C member 30 n=1 Tax=Gekko japonicus TaxID=146911 RepID=A0ABM1K5Q2_GEKJA|nr:PREDICTED: dnaJ homolog subfamily C member 30 [Gekko japonicus]